MRQKELQLTKDEQDDFREFYKPYPNKRGGPHVAAQAFVRLVRDGADPKQIIAGSMMYAEQTNGRDLNFVKRAATWLHARAWQEFFPPEWMSEPARADNVLPIRRKVFLKEGSPQHDAWCRHIGRRPPTKDGGWWFDSEWPPGTPDTCTA